MAGPLTEAEIAAIDARFEAGETVWMWAMHHETRCEPLTEPLSARIAYVRERKAAHEIPVRLAWMRPVQHPEALPEAVRQAWAAGDRARAAGGRAWAAYRQAAVAHGRAWAAYRQAAVAYDQAAVAYDQAQVAYDQALIDHEPAIRAQHEAECPGVPWDAGTGLRFG